MHFVALCVDTPIQRGRHSFDHAWVESRAPPSARESANADAPHVNDGSFVWSIQPLEASGLHHSWRWDGLEASRPPSSVESSLSREWAFVPPSSKGRVRSGIRTPFVGQRSIPDSEGLNTPFFGFEFSGIEGEQTRAKVGSMPPFWRGACFPWCFRTDAIGAPFTIGISRRFSSRDVRMVLDRFGWNASLRLEDERGLAVRLKLPVQVGQKHFAAGAALEDGSFVLRIGRTSADQGFAWRVDANPVQGTTSIVGKANLGRKFGGLRLKAAFDVHSLGLRFECGVKPRLGSWSLHQRADVNTVTCCFHQSFRLPFVQGGMGRMRWELRAPHELHSFLTAGRRSQADQQEVERCKKPARRKSTKWAARLGKVTFVRANCRRTARQLVCHSCYMPAHDHREEDHMGLVRAVTPAAFTMQDLAEEYARTPLNKFTPFASRLNLKRRADIKAVTLAQWMVESGHGRSGLAWMHGNFGGLKWRPDLQGVSVPARYDAHDGLDEYCSFDTPAGFIKGYFRFLDRKAFRGWHRDVAQSYNAESACRAYLRKLKANGYATDPQYEAKVLRLLPQAKALLRDPRR